MKISIEIDESLRDDEIIIRCSRLGENIQKIQEIFTSGQTETKYMVFQKGAADYYLRLETILFFETSDNSIFAHTTDNMYQTGYKLYELEELLPGYFMRISKSTIVNMNHIYSITRNLTSSSILEFAGTHKKAYVSRYYYKLLRERMTEKRIERKDEYEK